jgi:hypothetical protein
MSYACAQKKSLSSLPQPYFTPRSIIPSQNLTQLVIKGGFGAPLTPILLESKIRPEEPCGTQQNSMKHI